MDFTLKILFLPSCFLVCSIMSTSSHAENPKLEGMQMVFAIGYETTGKAVNNNVLIGSYTFKKQSFLAEYKEFDANANLKPKKGAFRHNLKAPYGKHACENRTIEIPSESAIKSVEGTWHIEGNSLKLTIDTQTYEWDIEVDEGSYKLRNIRDNATKQDLPLAVGFAYVSENQTARVKLKKENFLPYYRGDIYHKNNFATAQTPWEFKPSGMKVSVFAESDNGDTLHYSSRGKAESKGAWIGNSLLLNQDEKSSYIIYQDLGHDFNKNGCYDEFGHTKIILAAHNASSTTIHNMVFIEYSYAFDGFPLISVGRYYR